MEASGPRTAQPNRLRWWKPTPASRAYGAMAQANRIFPKRSNSTSGRWNHPSLAHPGRLRWPIAQLRSLIHELVRDGLGAIEVYHSDHTLQETSDLLQIAAEAGLLVTGGSDYHGENKPGVCLGTGRQGNVQVPDEALDILKRYDWPGNIRELQNFIERAVLMSTGASLDAPLAELTFVPKATADSTNRTLAEAERDYIFDVLRETNWLVGGRGGAAVRLGVPRTTLIHKMQRLGIGRGNMTSPSALHNRRLSWTAPSSPRAKSTRAHAGGA